MFASTRLMALAAVGIALFAVAVGEPRLLVLGAAYNLALAIFAGTDHVLARRRGFTPVAAERRLADHLSLGVGNLVSLIVRNQSAAELHLAVKDQPPVELAHDGGAVVLSLGPGMQGIIRYHVTPPAKGDYWFGDIWVRVRSPLGLLVHQGRMAARQQVRVFPDLTALRRYELLARRGRLQEAGIRASRYRGRGTEFESLRAYLPDDDSRHINWKATARRGQLITSQFQAERSQNVMLVLDAGRMMAGRVGQMTKLDYAINAALMAAYVCTAMGDRVGLLAFAQGIRAYLPPGRGRGQVFRLLQSLYRLEPELVESDYERAFRHLALQQRRRSLVIAFTDLVDRDSSETLLRQIGALHPHHLVLCVTLADAEVLALAHAMPVEVEQVYQKAVAAHVVADREAALSYLRHRGVHVVDAPADRLTTETINRYLELKSRSLV
jgi:uncharacterized protein (DUF58 family)